MQKLLSRADEFKNYQIESFPITSDNLLKESRSSLGQFILIPKLGENDWAEIQSFISQPVATSSVN
jgi:hypothetical protein